MLYDRDHFKLALGQAWEIFGGPCSKQHLDLSDEGVGCRARYRIFRRFAFMTHIIDKGRHNMFHPANAGQTGVEDCFSLEMCDSQGLC